MGVAQPTGRQAGIPCRRGVEGPRWVPWSSTPVVAYSVRHGGFDSHALPPDPRRVALGGCPAREGRRGACRGLYPVAIASQRCLHPCPVRLASLLAVEGDHRGTEHPSPTPVPARPDDGRQPPRRPDQTARNGTHPGLVAAPAATAAGITGVIAGVPGQTMVAPVGWPVHGELSSAGHQIRRESDAAIPPLGMSHRCPPPAAVPPSASGDPAGRRPTCPGRRTGPRAGRSRQYVGMGKLHLHHRSHPRCDPRCDDAAAICDRHASGDPLAAPQIAP